MQKLSQVLELATLEEEVLQKTSPQRQKTKETTTPETPAELGQAAASENTRQKSPMETEVK